MDYERRAKQMLAGNYYYPVNPAADKIEQKYNDIMHKVRFRIDRGDLHLMSFLGKAGSRGQNPPLWLKDESHVRNFDTKEFKRHYYK